MATTLDRQLGMRLRELRGRRGMTQAELASLLGVSTSLVVHWERGRRALSAVQVGRLARVLRVEPGAFADRR